MGFRNINECYGFNIKAETTKWKELSSFPCSEAVIQNNGGGNLVIADGNDANSIDPAGVPYSHRNVTLQDGTQLVFRGLTNCSQLSCTATSDDAIVQVRTQFFGSLMQR